MVRLVEKGTPSNRSKQTLEKLPTAGRESLRSSLFVLGASTQVQLPNQLFGTAVKRPSEFRSPRPRWTTARPAQLEPAKVDRQALQASQSFAAADPEAKVNLNSSGTLSLEQDQIGGGPVPVYCGASESQWSMAQHTMEAIELWLLKTVQATAAVWWSTRRCRPPESSTSGSFRQEPERPRRRV